MYTLALCAARKRIHLLHSILSFGPFNEWRSSNQRELNSASDSPSGLSLNSVLTMWLMTHLIEVLLEVL